MMITSTVMKQSSVVNDEMKPEHRKATNRNMIGPIKDTDCISQSSETDLGESLHLI